MLAGKASKISFDDPDKRKSFAEVTGIVLLPDIANEFDSIIPANLKASPKHRDLAQEFDNIKPEEETKSFERRKKGRRRLLDQPASTSPLNAKVESSEATPL